MSRDSYFATWLRFCLCNFAPVTRKIKTKDMDKKQLSRIALTAVLLFVAWMVKNVPKFMVVQLIDNKPQLYLR